jgi:hypothetical protein
MIFTQNRWCVIFQLPRLKVWIKILNGLLHFLGKDNGALVLVDYWGLVGLSKRTGSEADKKD